MRRIVLLLLTALLISSIAYNQRRLQFLTSADDAGPEAIPINGKAIIVYSGDDHFEIYDDETLATHHFPTVGGVTLRYHSDAKPCLFRSEVFMILWDSDTRYLYRFNGRVFRNIRVPGRIVSHCIVFGDDLYVLSEVGGSVKLFRYNGSSITEIPSAELPLTNRYRMIVGNNYLYLMGRSSRASDPPDVLMRFNGTSISSITDMDLRHEISELHAVGETGRVYFVFNSRIVYFDGTVATEIYNSFASLIRGVIWRNEFYFISRNGLVTEMYRAVGATLTEIVPPTGANFYDGCNPAVYRDRLFAQVDYGSGNAAIVEYDGTSFLPFLSLPGTISSGRLVLRDDDLIIHPDYVNGPRAIEYNGSEFIEILATPDYFLRDYLSATDCNYLWISSVDSGFNDPYHWTILKEPRNCPASQAALAVIPEHFRNYDDIYLSFNGSDRGWSWSEIILDWRNLVCSLPPCLDPEYQVRFADAFGKVAWSQDFNKPFVATVPLKDDQLYIASLLSVSKEVTQPLVVMADNLVPKGISTINLSMKPTKEYFKLSATTDKGIKTPLKVALLNADGKTIWEKEFMAPFTAHIKDKVKEPGQMLYFTIPQTQQSNSVTSVITTFNFYPNPAHGQLNLEVKTRDRILSTEVSITTMQGEIILKKMIQAPFTHNLTLPPCKPGLYILKLKTADEIVSKLFWIE